MFMYIRITKMNLAVLCLVPFLFACSKSKFSAIKATPIEAVTPRPQPLPIITQPQDVEPIDDEDDNNVTDCRIDDSCPAPIDVTPRPPKGPKCDEIVIDKPDNQNGVQGINVWVVMDGSKSNMKERPQQLKALISAYEKKLARQVPITVSVITGHSDESQYAVAYNNRMSDFFFQSKAGEPAVIKFSPGKDNKAAHAALKAKIQGMETDNSAGRSDGGELLAYNLRNAMHPDRLKWAASVGALKNNYLLQIVFLADENDICSPGQVEDENKVNGVEVEALSYNKYCLGMDTGVKTFNRTTKYSANNYSKNLAAAIQRLNDAKKGGIMLTGYLYTGAYPKDGENEFGNGLVQLINAFDGHAYDLAQLNSDQSYVDAAKDLAGHVNAESDLYVRFPFNKNGAPLDAVKYNITVRQGKRTIPTHPEGAYLVAEGRCENAPVYIEYCDK